MHRVVPKGIMEASGRPSSERGMYIMPYLLVRRKVADYERWKPVFDHDHAVTRKRRGSKGGWILANAYDPNELVILVEWDSLENARRFADADDFGRLCSGQESPINQTYTSWKS